MTILKAWQRSVVNRADQRMMCDGRLFRELSQNNRHFQYFVFAFFMTVR
jgi:hypothetical protein